MSVGFQIRLWFYLSLLACAALQAQPVLTPSPERTGSDAGADIGSYNITNSAETGYGFVRAGGDQSLFRSVENYGNGLRLFGASMTVNSKDGHGRLFDSALFTSSGLINDPYGAATVQLQKNQVFRYDMTWRRSEYYNPSTNNGESYTLKETTRTIQDHDLSIQVRPAVKLLLGYTRNHETGPEFTAYETYIGGLARSVLPLARDTRRDFHEYSLGTEWDFLGFRLTLQRRWEDFKDDSSIASLVPGQPYAAASRLGLPFDPTLELTYRQVATAYTRSQPMHTQRQGWLGNLQRQEKYWTLNARMTYSKGDSQTVYYENESGASQAAATNVPTGDGRFLSSSNSGYGPPATAFTYMPGTARQPYALGDFLFSVYPTKKLTLTTTTSVQSNRYDGTGNELRVLSTGAATINRFWTFHIGSGRVTAAQEINYKVTDWLGLNAEYRYTSRFIDNDLTRTGTTNGRDLNSIRNHLNLGLIGFHLRPIRGMLISADASVGRDNAPENPTSPAHTHNIRTRFDYRTKRVKFVFAYRQEYNLNAPLSVLSVSTGQLIVGQKLDYYDSHSRDYVATTSFDLSRHLSVDLSYNKAHIDTLANLWAELVPAGSTTITTVSTRGYTSQYISNVHTVSLMLRSNIGRIMFYAGYNLSQDTGDGRSVQNLGLTDLAAAETASWNTFPMKYQAPLARLSYKISPKLQWNAGWEFYRYNQQFSYFGYQPYYRVHTVYTSVSYTFGPVAHNN